MAEHAHTTPVTLARRRHTRAAPGASDRRWPAPETPAPAKPTVTRPPREPAGSTKTLAIQLSRAEGDGLPLGLDYSDGFATLPGQPALPARLSWTGVITPDLRRRIECDIDLLIALLDALDAAGEDLEPDNEDCCAAADDDPASSHPIVHGAGSTWGPGDPADGEITAEDEGEPTDDDLPHRHLPAAALRLTTTPCCNGPFQVDSSTYAIVRGWRTGRPA